MIASSIDLEHWSAPQVLLQAQPAERFWHATIIGEYDTQAGKRSLLLYAPSPDPAAKQRTFVACASRLQEAAKHITFTNPTPDIVAEKPRATGRDAS